jgi:molybdopterin-guanine dinucleotide biosynthesis protein A
LASTPDGNNSQSIHPTFGLWEVSLREDLRNSLNEGIRKMVKWTARHQSSSCVFTEGKFDRFFNINTPEDIFLAEDIIDKGWV